MYLVYNSCVVTLNHFYKDLLILPSIEARVTVHSPNKNDHNKYKHSVFCAYFEWQTIIARI